MAEVAQVRKAITLDQAAVEVQSRLRQLATMEGRGKAGAGSPRRVRVWLLSSGDRLEYKRIVTRRSIRQPKTSEETDRVRRAIDGLAFCNVHGPIPVEQHWNGPGRRPHVLSVGHSLGDYSIKPDGNLPQYDQLLIRLPGLEQFGIKESDTALCTSLQVPDRGEHK
jgi:hypothetical protein